MRAEANPLASFTLVEVLVVVGVIGILAGLAYVNITGVRESSADAKLRSDVRVINSALDAYRASGGVVASNAAATGVIRQLKLPASAGAGLPAFTNWFLDPRTKAVWQTEKEAQSGSLRAYYTDSPVGDVSFAPRFFVTNAGAGIGIREFVFDDAAAEGLTTDTSRTAMLEQAAPGGWVWTYEETAPPEPPFAPGVLPDTAVSTFTNVGESLTKLLQPVFEPPEADYDLSLFTNRSLTPDQGALLVRITSPNPPGAWAIFYALNDPPQTGSPNVGPGPYVRLTNPAGEVPVFPDTVLRAYVVSFDTSRFANSGMTEGLYGIRPVELVMNVSAPEKVNYLQATATNPPQAAVFLEENFDFSYATDAISLHSSTGMNDPRTQPPFGTWSKTNLVNLSAGLWGTNTNARVNAAALSSAPKFFSNSVVTNKLIGIELTEIPVEILPEDPIGIPPKVLIRASGYVPDAQATMIYYTLYSINELPGNQLPPLDPVEGGKRVRGFTNNAAGFRPAISGSYTIIAQATLPGLEQWFKSYAANTYTKVVAPSADLIGLNFSAGSIDGTVQGSLYLLGGNLSGLVQGTKIFGNVYLPGLPNMEIPSADPASALPGNGQLFTAELTAVTTDNVAYRATNGVTLNIPRTGVNKSAIGGNEYDRDGNKITNRLIDYRQIVDLDGVISQAPYTARLNPGAYIDGKIYRNADPPPLPDRPTFSPPFPLLSNAVTVGTNKVFIPGIPQTNSALQVAILPTNAAYYSVNMSSSSGVLQLGSTNRDPSITSRYFFDAGTWNAGRVEILGPVEIFFRGSFSFTGVTFGTTNTARQTVIYLTNGNGVIGGPTATKDVTLVNAVIDARTNTIDVQNSGTLYGSILAQTVNVAKDGKVLVTEGGR